MKVSKSTIGLAIAAVLCLALAFISARCSVSRTEKAIDNIGDISSDEQCKERLDRAIHYYDNLDPNLELAGKISNAGELEDAKREFVRISIKTAVAADQRKQIDGYTEEDILAFISNARTAANEYLGEEECEELENYADLLNLEKSYSGDDGEDGAAEEEDSAAEEVPLC